MTNSVNSSDAQYDWREDQREQPIQLRPSSWFVVLAMFFAIAFVFPSFVSLGELKLKETASPHFRLPSGLSDDYFLSSKIVSSQVDAHRTDRKDRVFCIGDSVMWGLFVTEQQTIPAILNRNETDVRFANLSVKGLHPVAMEEMVRGPLCSLHGEKVLLHFNPVWLRTPESDLSDPNSKEPISHVNLIPQFDWSIESYKSRDGKSLETLEKRCSRWAEKRIPIFQFANHVRQIGTNGESLYSWTLDHPMKMPAGDFEFADFQEPVPAVRRASQVDVPWINLANSIQWKAFERSKQILINRRNRLVIIVGPMNESALSINSQRAYRNLLEEIRRKTSEWPEPVIFIDSLPKNQMVDLSHPTSDGYQKICESHAPQILAAFE